MGAATLSISNTGGTDHLSFDAIGLPGFQFIQDEIEYDTRTHHSNQDVFDRIQADDMKQAATIMAAFVYNAATRDEKLQESQCRTGNLRRFQLQNGAGRLWLALFISEIPTLRNFASSSRTWRLTYQS